MTIRTILAGLSGGTASKGASELACRLAARFGAHVTALYVRPDLAGFVMAAGAEGLTATATMGWATEMSDLVEARRTQTRADFTADAARHGLPVSDASGPSDPPHAIWRDEKGEAAALLSYHARFFDLVVLGRSDRLIAAPHTDAIEQTLLHSGRPVLLAPAEPEETVGQTIALAWNGTAQAVHALIGALPFLRLARETIVIAVGTGRAEGADELAAYLRMHEIVARLDCVEAAASATSGSQLLSIAHDEGADLLVLGGYGHAPWREALLGGATSELLGRSLLPLLLSH